jgi:glycosyltransferase involved in cell wall biosynthesis
VTRLGLGNRVRHLGRLSQIELDGLYRGALAVVVPSEYEGFGMPVIEAEAAGAPVIASDHPGLDEACGDAALRVATADVAGWVAAVQSVRSDTQRRERLVAAGRRVAATFNWTDSARALVALHRSAWESPS